MQESTALIFGRNEYTQEIEKNIASEYKKIYIFELDDNSEDSFDLGENWDDLRDKVDIEDCIAFCILEDIAENLFLTISLRDTFKDLTIIALSNDIEGTDKLLLAGASRVLPSVETTANVIVDMLEKPVLTDVLHSILYEESDLETAEIQIQDNSKLIGKSLADIQWRKDYKLVLISVINEGVDDTFIYALNEKNHVLKCADILVVIGYDKDIEEFKKLTKVSM